MKWRFRAELLAGALVGSTAACGSGDAPAAQPAVRDSAGIRVVENASPAWTAATAWRPSARPVTTIGVVSGEAAHQLNGVVAAVRMSDGRIVVANGGTRELRFFTPEGTHIRTVGRRGEGPGEFRFLRQLARLAGDTLVAADLSPGRMLRFDGTGEFLGMSQQRIASSEVPIILPDASLLLPFYESMTFGGEFELFAVGRRIANADGVFRPPFDLVHVHRAAVRADTIGRFLGDALYKIDVPGSIGVTWYEPFAPRTLYAAGGDRVWVTRTDRAELAAYTLDGTLVMLVRFPAEPVAITDGDRAAFRASVEPRINPNRRADFERWFAEVPYPSVKPVASALVTGPQGTVWLERAVPFDAPNVTWSVFGADGTLLGDVPFPPRTELLEIGASHVLALWRDDLDVEFIHVYRIDGA